MYFVFYWYLPLVVEIFGFLEVAFKGSPIDALRQIIRWVSGCRDDLEAFRQTMIGCNCESSNFREKLFYFFSGAQPDKLNFWIFGFFRHY